MRRSTVCSLLLILFVGVSFVALVSFTSAQGVKVGYEEISPEDAKKIMAEDSKAIIVDVRNKDEYDEGHIAKAILLPLPDVKDDAARVLPNKDATILVYCKSGNRSKAASEILAGLGYQHVYEFGGVSTWPYGLVK